jgi:hypothetical protein
MFQSRLRHNEWGVYKRGMMADDEAEKSLRAAAIFYGREHVQILRADKAAMRRVLKQKTIKQSDDKDNEP